MIRTTAFLSGLAVALPCAVAACHAEEPRSPEVGLTSAVSPPTVPDLGRGAPRREMNALYNIYIGEPLAAMCKGPAPFFAFDSTKVNATEQPTMQILANCMLDGPLAGRAVRLVGRADPRGNAAYNDKLGRERAAKVKGYLVGRGIDPGRIVVDTQGEANASGKPDDFPNDRRVDVQLVPRDDGAQR